MTVYVDDVQIPAAVRNGLRVHDSTWSHLTADTQEELHTFAEALGLKREYFQPGLSLYGDQPVGWHYDVTKGKRLQALRLGAQHIGIEGLASILRKRRAELDKPQEQPKRCHEIARMADEAFRAGDIEQARGLLILARMAFPDHADWWDRREAIVAEREAAS